MAIDGFGPLEFQLVLLRRMADFRPGEVEDAVLRLGSDRTAMREANRRWQAMIRSRGFPRGDRRYRAVLGPPESAGRRRVGDLELRVLRWPVPLWPELRFEVLLAPGGAVFNEWLVRAPGTAPPPLRTLEDLAPWSCTVGDVAAAFAPARPMEGTAPGRWRLAFTAPDADGTARGAVADFTWGLLQEVRTDGGPAAPGTAGP
ncbi:hypothetical protein [Streptomyces sp. NPDC001380]|uniref:hypothetical protein n=1 Tax=Streptomyces sp. NPDC001380 TaxID=3364566 RepID=UPI003683D632